MYADMQLYVISVRGRMQQSECTRAMLHWTEVGLVDGASACVWHLYSRVFLCIVFFFTRLRQRGIRVRTGCDAENYHHYYYIYRRRFNDSYYSLTFSSGWTWKCLYNSVRYMYFIHTSVCI